jgi:ribosomal protein L37AE/L43A
MDRHRLSATTPACPDCGSWDVGSVDRGWWRCISCGHLWSTLSGRARRFRLPRRLVPDAGRAREAGGGDE